jgi:heptosyltransferase-2
MRILLVRTDRLGDVLLSTPVARALKKASAENHVTMLVRPYTKPVLKENPHVDDVILYDPHGGDSDLVRTLKRGRFDAAVVLHPTFRLAKLLARSGIPKRFGTASRVYSLLFNQRIPVRRSSAGLHEAECNLAMVEPLCGKNTDLLPEFFLTESERKETEKVLRSLALNSRGFVVIHPGSGGSARDWSLRSFASLADAVETQLKRRVVVTGGPDETDLVSRMTSLMRKRPTTMVGNLDIRQLGAVLSESAVVVTNSTGPMHLATAVRTPVVAIFCPMDGCSPGRWGPLGSESVVLMPQVPSCRRCTGERCSYYDCMDGVSVEEVLGAIERLLLE